ncbi:MAG: hypothetical protein V1822_01245 [Candidatus Micrarchaeota archaeon]
MNVQKIKNGNGAENAQNGGFKVGGRAKNPNKAFSLYNRAKEYQDEARHHARKAKEFPDGSVERLNFFRHAKNSFEQAVEFYHEAIQNVPDDGIYRNIRNDLSSHKQQRVYVAGQVERLEGICRPFIERAMSETIYV